MNINEYVEEVLTVLKKNEKLEQLLITVAGDSDLALAKDTIQGIKEDLAKERIVELTKAYFGKRVAHVEGGKLGHKRGLFARRKQNE